MATLAELIEKKDALIEKYDDELEQINSLIRNFSDGFVYFLTRKYYAHLYYFRFTNEYALDCYMKELESYEEKCGILNVYSNNPNRGVFVENITKELVEELEWKKLKGE